MDHDSKVRLQISNELGRLLAQQTHFFRTGARRGHTPNKLREERVRVLFELLEQMRKVASA